MKSIFFKISILSLVLTPIFLNGQIILIMQKEGGVYTIPCSVNRLPLRFIFDTGLHQLHYYTTF